MADTSTIEWTDATWNPITGCTMVSAGCTNCYAMGLAATRLKHHPSRAGLTRKTGGRDVWTGEVRFNEKWLTQPLQWSRPRMIFVCAHGDLFHPAVPDDWIDRVFAVMALAPWHTFQVLTKRPERMRDYLTRPKDPEKFTTVGEDGVSHPTPAARVRTLAALCDMLPVTPAQALNRASAWQDEWFPEGDGFMRCWPLPNVWIGTSIEDQDTADQRVPHLLASPAAVRFLSVEPMLGPIDLTNMSRPAEGGTHEYSALDCDVDPEDDTDFHGATIDWVICGGESGTNARPMHPDWARRLRDQCGTAGTAFFFKQWGQWLHESQPEEKTGYLDWENASERDLLHNWSDGTYSIRLRKSDAGRLLDGRTWNEVPPHA